MWVCTLGARVHKGLVGGSKTNCGFRFGGQTKLRSKAECAHPSGITGNEAKKSGQKSFRDKI